jgi:hypothetical protein
MNDGDTLMISMAHTNTQGSQIPRDKSRHDDQILQVCAEYLYVPSKELASYHISGAYKLAIAPRFLEKLCNPLIYQYFYQNQQLLDKYFITSNMWIMVHVFLFKMLSWINT